MKDFIEEIFAWFLAFSISIIGTSIAFACIYFLVEFLSAVFVDLL